MHRTMAGKKSPKKRKKTSETRSRGGQPARRTSRRALVKKRAAAAEHVKKMIETVYSDLGAKLKPKKKKRRVSAQEVLNELKARHPLSEFPSLATVKRRLQEFPVQFRAKPRPKPADPERDQNRDFSTLAAHQRYY